MWDAADVTPTRAYRSRFWTIQGLMPHSKSLLVRRFVPEGLPHGGVGVGVQVGPQAQAEM